MSAQTAVCMGGRYGDLANILPCVRDIALKEGGKCAVVVSDEFASILDGCSYVEKVVISSHFTDILPAIEMAKSMYPRVLVGKVNEKSIGVTTQCQSFSQESWRQCGYLDRYEDLPLVFDRRDRERERRLIDRYIGKHKYALFNLSGRSSPVPNGLEWMNRNRDAMCRNVQWLDLAQVLAHRVYDLIGLMDGAEVLVTGDTATLHLAAASDVPVINLIQYLPTRWHGSKPRNNSIAAWRYDEMPNTV